MTYLTAAFILLSALSLGACATAPGRGAGRGGDPAAATDRPAWPGSLPVEERIDRARPLVDAAAAEFALPADLLMAVIWVESRFRPDARSPVGARGLTQLMPGTAGDMAERLGLPRDAAAPHDPSFAVRAGAAYLRVLLDRFQGDVNTALAAYASGPGRVRTRLGDDGGLPAAARRYAGEVQRARRRFRGPAAPLSLLRGLSPPPPPPAA